MKTPSGRLPEDSTPTLTIPHAGTRRGWDPWALTCLSSLSPTTVAITYQLLVVFPSHSALGSLPYGHNTQLKLVPQTLVSQSPNISPSRSPLLHSPQHVGRPPQLTGRLPCPSHAPSKVPVAHTRVPRFLQSVLAPWPAILTLPAHTSLLPSFAGLCSPWTVLWGTCFLVACFSL